MVIFSTDEKTLGQPSLRHRFLVFFVLQALSKRAKKAKAARKPNLSEMKPGIVIENVAQTRRLAETTLVASSLVPSSLLDEGPTCTGSGSQVRLEGGMVLLNIFYF